MENRPTFEIEKSSSLFILCCCTNNVEVHNDSDSSFEDSCHSMFFQLKLQTFFIQVGSDKAEIHKMARWHLVYYLLSSGGRKKNKNDP